MEIAEILSSGISQLGLTISDSAQQKMLDYLKLLKKWNKTYNLTAITDEKEMVVKHLLDSLAVVPYIKADRVLDVGTGAGLPGIPLALALPKTQFILLDSSNKKTRFLEFVRVTLEMPNIEIITTRVENYNPETKFSCIISRAVGKVPELIAKTERLLTTAGELLLMVGKHVPAELDINASTHKLYVPYLNAERKLLVFNSA